MLVFSMFGASMLMLATSGIVLCSSVRGQATLFFQKPTGTEGEISAPSGGDVVLECEAGGSPTPLIRWFRRGHEIVQGGNSFDDFESLTYSNRRRIGYLKSVLLPQNFEEEITSKIDLGLTKSRLFLDCVSASDAGVYTCVAETPTKKISADLQIHINDMKSSDSAVERRCRKKRYVQDAAAAARIYLWTMQRVEVEGGDVELFCRAFGNPAPKITWFDPENRTIGHKANGQYEILYNGDLVIRNVNWIENMGLYRCLAQNEAGSDEVSTFVYPTAAE